MKHFLSLLFALLLTAGVSAQTVGMSPFGYGKDVTGGGSATPTLVTSTSDLQTALTASGSKVIIITKSLTFSSLMKVKATNKTLMALPGVTISNLNQTQSGSGVLYFKSGSSNLILRNLTFVGPGAYDCDGNDLLCFDGVTKAWVDHCDFQDGCDGNFDNKGTTDNITVSWCRFRYLKTPKAGGSGGTDDHRFSDLLGSSSSDKPSDGTYNMTWAYCWWDDGCVERMLRCRNASLHFLNCYWNSSVANYYVGPQNADCYFEGCSMQGKPAKAKYFYENYGGTNGSKWVNCIAKNGVPSNVSSRTVTTPTYSYTALTAANAVTAVTDATCGAGATLKVTTGGTVSSGCEGGTVVNTYTVTFNANGHGTAPAAITANENSTITAPTAPTASGYTFGGWYKESACTNAWNFSSDVVTGNTTLYAKWTASTTPGGETTSNCYSLLSAPSLPNGMTITVNGAAPSYDATNGITLSTNTDYLCFDVSGMDATITSATVTLKSGSQEATKGFVYGSSCAASFTGTEQLNTAKTFTDYTLSGLNTDVLSIRRKGTSVYVSNICLTISTGGGSSTTCTDPTLEYTVTDINKTMGDAKFQNPLTNTNGLTVTYSSSDKSVASVSSTGYVQLNGAGTAFITATAAEQTVGGKLYCAKSVSYNLDVAPATIYYTLSYLPNGASGTQIDSTYEEGDEATVAGCSFTAPSGQYFTGWNTAAAGTGTAYAAGDVINMQANVTLYAQWADTPTPSGDCQASVFWCGTADATGQTQSSYITGITTGTKSASGSLIINGQTYTATKGAQVGTSNSVGIEVPANYTATLYVSAASTSTNARTLKLSNSNSEEIGTAETASSSTQAKQISFSGLTSGNYTLVTTGGGSIFCIVALELCPTGSTDLEEVKVDETVTRKFFRNGHLYILRDGQLYDSTGRLTK